MAIPALFLSALFALGLGGVGWGAHEWAEHDLHGDKRRSTDLTNAILYFNNVTDLSRTDLRVLNGMVAEPKSTTMGRGGEVVFRKGQEVVGEGMVMPAEEALRTTPGLRYGNITVSLPAVPGGLDAPMAGQWIVVDQSRADNQTVNEFQNMHASLRALARQEEDVEVKRKAWANSILINTIVGGSVP